MSMVREQGSEMVKQGEPVETEEHPLSGSGVQRAIALHGDCQPRCSAQAGETSICRYQAEGGLLEGILFIETQMMRKTWACEGPNAEYLGVERIASAKAQR